MSSTVAAPPQLQPWAAPKSSWHAPVICGALTLGGTIYTAALDPNHVHAFPLCPLKLVTGLDCPFCGCLRATHALAHGNIVTAADHNLLFTVASPFLVVTWALWLLRSTGHDAPHVVVSRPVKLALLAVVIAFTVARNLPVAGLHWLNASVG